MGMTISDILPDPLDKMFVVVFIAIGLTFFLLAKKYITKPRLGYVKFGLSQKTRKIKSIIVLIINFIAILIINLIRFTNPELRFPGYLDVLFLGLLLITIPLCFTAYFIHYTRLYITAILFGISFFLSELFALIIPEPFDVLLTFSLVGGIIILIGVIFLIKFIRKYPLPREGMS